MGMLAKDFPPFSLSGLFLRMASDRAVEPDQPPSRHWRHGNWREDGKTGLSHSGLIDSQSVKTTEAAALPAFDAGKKINGRKRHIMSTRWPDVGLMVHGADVQDRRRKRPIS